MNRKKILMLLVFVALIIGAFVLVQAIETSTIGADSAKGTEVTGATASKDSGASASSEKKAAAEELIGETLSREEIEQKLGAWEEFDMNSAGCERGVYAGEFYYEDFQIFSRTYNKGKTFRIVSVNE